VVRAPGRSQALCSGDAGRHSRDPNLSVIEEEADELIVSNARVTGIRLADAASCPPVPLSSPPHLSARLIHLGEKNWPAACRRSTCDGLSKSFERAALRSDG